MSIFLKFDLIVKKCT